MALSAKDYRSLADQFTGLAASIVDFERNNRQDLNDSDFKTIDELRVAASHYSDQFLLQAIQQTLKDLDVPLAQVSAATTNINQALRTLNNINTAFAIAAAGIQLGAAFMTGQVPAITRALGKVIQLVGSSSGSSSGGSQASPTSS